MCNMQIKRNNSDLQAKELTFQSTQLFFIAISTQDDLYKSSKQLKIKQSKKESYSFLLKNSFRLIVLFRMIGLAQKPTLKI